MYRFLHITGKRKLKKSGIFDQSITSSQNGPQEAASLTDNFVLSKAFTHDHQKSSDTKEDSQFSSYDASQHFERTDYSVTNIINQLEATIDRDPVDSFSDILNSDSEGDAWNSPTRSKRTCQLTNSQKNVMDKTFDFDEVDRVNSEKKPRKKPRKHQICKDENVRSKIRSKEISPTKSSDCVNVDSNDSPSKMITFNSNYADNSDIVTDIDHGSLEPDNDQIEALERIKSPTIVGPKKLKPSNSRRSGKSTTQKCSANNVRRELNKDLDHVHSKKKPHKILTSSDKSKIDLNDVSSLSASTNYNTLDRVLSSDVVQAPEITSTSDSKPRRMSQRTRHSSYKLTDPNFVLSQSAGRQCRNKDRDSSHSVADAETVLPESDLPTDHGISGKLKKNVDDIISSSKVMSSESFTTIDGRKDIRKSNRKRRANSKYSIDASSSHRPSSCDSSLAEQPSDKENNPTADLPGNRSSVAKNVEKDISSSLQICDKKASRKSCRVRKSNPKYQSDSVDQMVSKTVLDTDLLKTDRTNFKNPLSSNNEDLSASEYSTTETPVIKKTLTKREKKPAAIVTTTDTEESASERLDVKPSSKRKKAKKCDISDGSDLVKKRRSQNNVAPAADVSKLWYIGVVKHYLIKIIVSSLVSLVSLS